MNKILFLLLFFPLLAIATPSGSVLEKIRDSYNPSVNGHIDSEDRSRAGCSIRKITITGQDPISREPRGVRIAEYFRGDDAARAEARVIVIVPPTGGVNPLDQGYANSFCEQGFRAELVYGWDHDDSLGVDLATHDVAALRALVALKHVVDFANPLRERQLGMLGTSLGGLMASLAVGEEPRIAAAALVVAGGPLPEIMARTEQQEFAQLREKRMQAYGYRDVDEYEAALRAAMQFDNQDFARFTGAKPIWMSLALNDTKVPTKNQFSLEKAWGPDPENVFESRGTHMQVILSTYATKRNSMLNFFKKELK